MAPATVTSRTAAAQPAPAQARHVPIDPPEPAQPVADQPALSKPAAFQARLDERVALRGQVERLESSLREAVEVQDRAVARRAVDGSNEARVAADAAVGAVVRVEAELGAVRSALARLDAQMEANRVASEANKALARLTDAAALANEMQDLAKAADTALTAFAADYAKIVKKVGELHAIAPADHRDLIFQAGYGLSVPQLAVAVQRQLAAKAGIGAREAFASDRSLSLSSLVTAYTKGLVEAAEAVQPIKVEWE